MIKSAFLAKRIEIMQEELESLKRTVLKPEAKNDVIIRGLWKGTDFSDEEVEEAKLSWLKK
jgi:hypothetical protein